MMVRIGNNNFNSNNIKIKKMKKLILVIAIAGFITQSQAQKIKEKDAPGAVTAAFYKTHPTIKDASWSTDGNNFEASYNTDKTNIRVTYNPSGTVIETEAEITSSMLPVSVMEYVKANYKEEEIMKASKITAASGTITYLAEVNGMDLIFDSKGNHLKSIKTEVKFLKK